MSQRLVSIATANLGIVRVAAYPCRARHYAPTFCQSSLDMAAVTHLATGLAAFERLPVRAAQVICVVMDQLLPEETVFELNVAFKSLPERVRFWIELMKSETNGAAASLKTRRKAARK